MFKHYILFILNYEIEFIIYVTARQLAQLLNFTDRLRVFLYKGNNVKDIFYYSNNYYYYIIILWLLLIIPTLHNSQLFKIVNLVVIKENKIKKDIFL